MKLTLDSLEDQLYLGHINGPCSYLDGRDSSLLFLDGRGVGSIYRLLLDAGYRRHGYHIYRPDCSSCRECQILRIAVQDFVPSRNQKRVLRRAESVFEHSFAPTGFSIEKLDLYNRYLAYQHGRNGDPPISERQYRDFFVESCLGDGTFEMQLYRGGQLVGVAILDTVGDALSAVYFFFDPSVADYSPGTYAILKEIEMAREHGLAYFYPGYYIAHCAAMNYKARFKPALIRRVGEDKWRSLQSDSEKSSPNP